MRKTIMAFVLVSGVASRADASIYISAKAAWSDIKIEKASTTDYTPTMGVAPEPFLLPDSGAADNIKLDSVRGNVAVGYQGFSRSMFGIVRVEAEYGAGPHKGADLSTQSPVFAGNPVRLRTKTSTWFINGYYDIPLTSRFRPYVGTGVGFAKIKSTVAWSDTDTTASMEYFMDDRETVRNFAYNIGGGIAFVSGSFVVDLGYRYNNLGHVEMSANGMAEPIGGGGAYANSVSEIKYDMTSEEILLGLRYVF